MLALATLIRSFSKTAGCVPIRFRARNPNGVHGPSQVIDLRCFRLVRSGLEGYRAFAIIILYELHIGTFTPEGTFASAIPRLEPLEEILESPLLS